jgi:hypothetical protein
MMLDGIDIPDRTHVVALGITTDGVKIPLALWEGSTENATLAHSVAVTDFVRHKTIVLHADQSYLAKARR